METDWFTPVEEIPALVAEVRAEFGTFKTFPVKFRKQQLRNLFKMLNDNRPLFHEVLHKDLHKSPFETNLMELDMTSNEIVEALKSLDSWAAPEKPALSCQIQKDPKGTVLIISPWNYPVQLSLAPLVGALAAGCCAIIKPSELSVNTSKLLAVLVPKYLDSKCYKVVNGAVAETNLLLEQRWDHIMYTGSGTVAKIIMGAAARQLCPVTLELGGKSPAVVDSNVDFAIVANRIVWGRFLNIGQTCIAPDYVIALPGVQDVLIQHIKTSITNFYGENPKTSKDYSRIVNKRHFDRLSGLLNSGTVAIGGETDESELYIAPTVLIDVNVDSPVMKDEIFGPILPIINVKTVDEAIAFVNSRDKPLALYCFSKDQRFVKRVATYTFSGGFIANDTIVHVATSGLPFGGVGPSGMGAYHGKASFDTFTHNKAVLLKQQNLEGFNTLRYPPYSDSKYDWLKFIGVKKLPRESVKLLNHSTGISS